MKTALSEEALLALLTISSSEGVWASAAVFYPPRGEAPIFKDFSKSSNHQSFQGRVSSGHRRGRRRDTRLLELNSRVLELNSRVVSRIVIFRPLTAPQSPKISAALRAAEPQLPSGVTHPEISGAQLPRYVTPPSTSVAGADPALH